MEVWKWHGGRPFQRGGAVMDMYDADSCYEAVGTVYNSTLLLTSYYSVLVNCFCYKQYFVKEYIHSKGVFVENRLSTVSECIVMKLILKI